MQHDVVLIVDQYQRHKDAVQHNQKIEPGREAQGLSMLINPFGRHNRRIAIVAEDDDKGLTAYQKAGYETIAVNGNRPTEIRRFIRQVNQTLETTPPKHLILVTTDPTFDLLCDHATKRTNLAVWAPSASVPSELTDPLYNYRRLEELLPDLKTPKIDIRLDYENLHIGLKQMGWSPNPKTLIEAVKGKIADLGDIANIVAYADWSALSKGTDYDIQRELALLDVETRYQVNMRGKNSADMKIADDVRTLVEKDHTAPDAVDIIVLGTGDRDFRPTVDTAKSRGKQVVILALKDSLSSELKRAANEVRYLDDHMNVPQPMPRQGAPGLDPFTESAKLVMQLAVWLRRKGYKGTFANQLNKITASSQVGEAGLRQALEAKILIEGRHPVTRANGQQGQAKFFIPNFKHPLVQAIYHLAEWAPARIDYCLKEKGFDYVGSPFLVKGMTMDSTFSRLGLGQNWQQAEGWLDLAATAGIIVKKLQPHPKEPGRMITTWWLPEVPSPKEIETADAVSTAEVADIPQETTSTSQVELEVVDSTSISEVDNKPDNDTPEETSPVQQATSDEGIKLTLDNPSSIFTPPWKKYTAI